MNTFSSMRFLVNFYIVTHTIVNCDIVYPFCWFNNSNSLHVCNCLCVNMLIFHLQGKQDFTTSKFYYTSFINFIIIEASDLNKLMTSHNSYYYIYSSFLKEHVLFIIFFQPDSVHTVSTSYAGIGAGTIIITPHCNP